MSVQPQDFIDSASEMYNQKSEICLRNSLSRAYYGSFHAISRTVPPNAFKSDDGLKVGIHKRYIDQLINSENELERKLGIRLNKLFGRRRKADYLLNEQIKEIEAYLQLQITKEVFALLNPT